MNTVSEMYFASISEFRPMSLEQEYALATAAKAGDTAARNTLIENNQGLIIRTARRYYGMSRGLEFMDLVQMGNIGLLHAIKKFEPHRGTRFSTYSVFWIRAYIRRWTMRGSAELACSDRHLEHIATRRSANPIGGPLTAKQSSEAEKTMSYQFVPLDATAKGETDPKGNEIGTLIGEPIDYEELADLSILKDRLKDLPKKQKEALYYKFSVGLTNQQIGEKIGLSREGARILIEDAITTLRIGFTGKVRQ